MDHNLIRMWGLLPYHHTTIVNALVVQGCKITAIKHVREITGLGLSDAKTLVEHRVEQWNNLKDRTWNAFQWLPIDA